MQKDHSKLDITTTCCPSETGNAKAAQNSPNTSGVPKDEHTNYKIQWTILAKAAAYNNKTKHCNLCLTGKLHIIRADTATLLNKISELISKCRYENKFMLILMNLNLVGTIVYGNNRLSLIFALLTI